MVIGALFILAGILIAVNPPLLSLIVASVLIMIGLSFVSMSYHYKRMSKQFKDPFMDFFIRF